MASRGILQARGFFRRFTGLFCDFLFSLFGVFFRFLSGLVVSSSHRLVLRYDRQEEVYDYSRCDDKVSNAYRICLYPKLREYGGLVRALNVLRFQTIRSLPSRFRGRVRFHVGYLASCERRDLGLFYEVDSIGGLCPAISATYVNVSLVGRFSMYMVLYVRVARCKFRGSRVEGLLEHGAIDLGRRICMASTVYTCIVMGRRAIVCHWFFVCSLYDFSFGVASLWRQGTLRYF